MDSKIESPRPALTPVPSDWTEEKDIGWYRQQFESEATDPHGEAVERLWRARKNLEDSLATWIGIFQAEENFDPDPVTECLGATAKADLLLTIIQAQPHDAGQTSGFQKDVARVKGAFDACDRVANRCAFHREKVWLFEIGTVVEELARSAWQLTDSIRSNHHYTRRPRVEGA